MYSYMNTNMFLIGSQGPCTRPILHIVDGGGVPCMGGLNHRHAYRDYWRVPAFSLEQLAANGNTYLWTWKLQQFAGPKSPVRSCNHTDPVNCKTETCVLGGIVYTVKKGHRFFFLSPLFPHTFFTVYVMCILPPPPQMDTQDSLRTLSLLYPKDGAHLISNFLSALAL